MILINAAGGAGSYWRAARGYDYEGHREPVGMQPGDVPVTYTDDIMMDARLRLHAQNRDAQGFRVFAEWRKGYCVKGVLNESLLTHQLSNLYTKHS